MSFPSISEVVEHALEVAAPEPGSFVAKGTVLLMEDAYSTVLRQAFRKGFCDYCFLKPLSFQKPLAACTQCRCAFYCNKECQQSDWSQHKGECKGLAGVTADEVLCFPEFDLVRAVARTLTKTKLAEKSDALVVGRLGLEGVERRFENLMSHEEDIKKEKPWMDQYNLIVQGINRILSSKVRRLVTAGDILAAYGRFQINAHDLANLSSSESIGNALFLSLSGIDHACAPTAELRNIGRIGYIIAVRDIPEFAWDRVRIFYGTSDSIAPTSERQMFLRFRYFFICDCETCRDMDRNKEMFSRLCPSCKSGPLPAIPKLTGPVPTSCSQSAVFPCLSCGELSPPSEAEIGQYFSVLQQSQALYARKQEADDEETSYKEFDEEVLRVLGAQKEAAFHPHNVYRIRLLQMAFSNAALEKERASEALDFGKELLVGLQRYSTLPSEDSTVAKFLFQLAAVEKGIGRDKEAEERMKKVRDFARISFSPFHLEVIRRSGKQLWCEESEKE